ncbi:uncharacterized protein LOC129598241 [Paramacrobiotus metropolitanus]|uniref:uncharacterized protein LOC129598241 n=1 Tax=Paramacrobiotus metropolitanus TaxID=2943436 RepID=UPI00244573AB|nr:uncharacterized protein LOC129598241 [Paramacrobiotus metropolitanus]
MKSSGDYGALSALVLILALCTAVRCQNVNRNACSIPLNPRTQPVDPYQMSGVWYEYLVYTPGTIGDNVYNVLIPLNTQNPGYVTYNRTISFLLRTPAPVCVGICLVSNIGTDGREATTGWFPNPTPGGAPIKSNVVYNTIFTDYHSVQIKYLCNQQPPPTNGICDSPYFWAYTRIKPTLLDAATKKYVNATVDNVLSGLCMSTRNMTLTGFDDNLPGCTPAWPTDCTALMQSVRPANSSNNGPTSPFNNGMPGGNHPSPFNNGWNPPGPWMSPMAGMMPFGHG